MVSTEFELDPDPRETAEQLRELGDMIEKGGYEYGEEIALRVVADARRGAPVDTGRLRSDIDYNVEANGGTVVIEVGNNVFYAQYQEILNPYLRPAWSSNEQAIARIIREFIRDRQQEALG